LRYILSGLDFYTVIMVLIVSNPLRHVDNVLLLDMIFVLHL